MATRARHQHCHRPARLSGIKCRPIPARILVNVAHSAALPGQCRVVRAFRVLPIRTRSSMVKLPGSAARAPSPTRAPLVRPRPTNASKSPSCCAARRGPAPAGAASQPGRAPLPDARRTCGRPTAPARQDMDAVAAFARAGRPDRGRAQRRAPQRLPVRHRGPGRRRPSTPRSNGSSTAPASRAAAPRPIHVPPATVRHRRRRVRHRRHADRAAALPAGPGHAAGRHRRS